jgi:hypothetical protein
MPELNSPWVNVQIDTLAIDPGQTITLYVVNELGHKTQIEVRCVGRPGATTGHVEIFCDDTGVFPDTFDEWRPMEDAYRLRRGLPREPQPARREE